MSERKTDYTALLKKLADQVSEFLLGESIAREGIPASLGTGAEQEIQQLCATLVATDVPEDKLAEVEKALRNLQSKIVGAMFGPAFDAVDTVKCSGSGKYICYKSVFSDVSVAHDFYKGDLLCTKSEERRAQSLGEASSPELGRGTGYWRSVTTTCPNSSSPRRKAPAAAGVATRKQGRKACHVHRLVVAVALLLE